MYFLFHQIGKHVKSNFSSVISSNLKLISFSSEIFLWIISSKISIVCTSSLQLFGICGPGMIF